jgi:cell division protein FtsX
MEGLLQGVTGGLLASGALFIAHQFVQQSAESMLATVLFTHFLPPIHLLTLVGLGALAGLVGAVTSLRREHLVEAEEQAAAG